MRPDKRQAILRGALSVFSRDGYSRASIDAIAKESEVSTRTLYNHFADKADLFRNVIQASASEAARTRSRSSSGTSTRSRTWRRT